VQVTKWSSRAFIMYIYRKEHLLNHLNQILQRSISQEALNWFAEKTFQIIDGSTSDLYTAFTAAPRKVGKVIVSATNDESELFNELLPGFTMSGYTADRLARVVLLLNWPAENRGNYIKSISQLFKAAEMNELVALYGALPVLAYPDAWIEQCRDGIRSNIGSVLEAIICDNPYPAQYLPEPAWNQLVLKAFFTDKDIHRIIGLDRRANKSLAYTLSDYAHERWAAGRTFDVQLWRVATKFIDERIFPDLERVLTEGNEFEMDAAALTCYYASYAPAKSLLNQHPEIKTRIETKELSWDTLAIAVKAFSGSGNKS
jgi:hypothetical protein